MALVPCSRCRQQISDQSSVCRHCGAPVGQHPAMYKPKRNFFFHYLMSMLMAVVGAAIYVSAMTGTEMSPYLVMAAPIMGIGGTAWYVCARILAYLG